MIKSLVRPNIRSLQPYSSARDEFTGSEAIFLDANENPFGQLNRYPDPHQTALKAKLSKLKGLPSNQIFIGNGSDETIDLALRIFCEPGKDKIMICPPTYGMYKVAADINNVGVVEVPLTKNFQLNMEEILRNKEEVKIIFICSPNNPTGNNLNEIEEVLQKFPGIVFVDEAYIDFTEKPSCLEQINKYPNLIISQTFSKARGRANIRVGMAFAGNEIIDFYNRVKPPYNVSGVNQQKAMEALDNAQEFERNLKDILLQRALLMENLREIEWIQKVFPSDANFILIQCENATAIYDQLVKENVVIRNRSSQIPNTLRITVGTAEENQTLLKKLKEL